MNTVNFFKKSAIALIIATVAFAGCEKNHEDDPNAVKVFNIALSISDQTLRVNESISIEAYLEPYDATELGITWSSNPAGWVNATGAIAARITVPATATPGKTATITATAKDGGGATASIIITVDPWVKKSNFGGAQGSVSVMQGIGSKVYAFAGNTKDMWEYDIPTDKWTALTAYTGDERYSGDIYFSFVIGTKLYVGYPYYYSGHNYALLEYNTATGAWTRKNDVPKTSANNNIYITGAAFSYRDKGYLLTANNSLYIYNNTGDSWEIRAVQRGGQYALCMGNKAYVFAYGAFWEYNIDSDTWLQRSNFPTSNIDGDFAFAFDKVYHARFYNNSYNSYSYFVHVFDSDKNQWSQAGTYPGTVDAGGLRATAANGKAYMLGGDNTFYEFTPPK